ncbi:AMP-binding protein [Streptomyces sp. NBC_00441]|uniref:AMP-binding protein n=1 Tax=Streptomyces sp. NBC_00441 TaxID=2975742 RepID=UPI002E2E491C|nr:AMP-binding protein [Streptomyces sp. NBC_00441]
MKNASAHLDTFCSDSLPAVELRPNLTCNDPTLSYPAMLNLGEVLLEGSIARFGADRPCLIGPVETWTYGQVRTLATQMAEALTSRFSLVPGNRVMILGPNDAWYAITWLAVLRAGCVAVPASPQLTAPELARLHLATRTDALAISAALSDRTDLPAVPHAFYGGIAEGDLVRIAADCPGTQVPISTSSQDVAFLVSTSGTTGTPKVTAHFHHDLLYIADAWSAYALSTTPDDIFAGTPHLSFTYGLCSRLAMPLRHGAATILTAETSAKQMVEAIGLHKATVCVSSPTAYRAVAAMENHEQLSSLRVALSSGEGLAASTWRAFRQATGLEILEALGTTECTSTFTSNQPGDLRPGSVGRPLPAYRIRILDDMGNVLQPGEEGWLAVQGPTGCRYLNDDRQKAYVIDGWNITGDIFSQDRDGYLWFKGRNDDLINAAGHKFYPAEIEEILLRSDLVHEGVITRTPIAGTDIVTAVVVLSPGVPSDSATRGQLIAFLAQHLAPYKIPRNIKFVGSIARTITGKLRRVS